jgi:hypothetical protein
VSVEGRFSGWAVGGWVTTKADIGKSRLPPEMADAKEHLFSQQITEGCRRVGGPGAQR